MTVHKVCIFQNISKLIFQLQTKPINVFCHMEKELTIINTYKHETYANTRRICNSMLVPKSTKRVRRGTVVND